MLGPNGAGKSTTLKMLTCFLPPTSGNATIGGIALDADALAIRKKIGYLPENSPSYSELDVRTHLTFIGRMHQIPAATLEDCIASMSQLCGLQDVLTRRIDELSKGFRQRVGLAASMLHDPECLILDEPTSGLDPNQIIEIRGLIRRLAEQKTVILSSHVLSEVEATCDRMLIIDKGKLVALGTVEELGRQASGRVHLHVTLKGAADRVVAKLREKMPDVEIDMQESAGATDLHLHAAKRGAELAETTFHAAVEAKAVIVEMRGEHASLEDVFRKLTGSDA